MSKEIVEIAASIGSDVPFFLGCAEDHTAVLAARAQGRGEQLTPIKTAATHNYVIVFPAESLSTAKVYAAPEVPSEARSGEGIIHAMANGMPNEIKEHMFNRLSEPARKILPRIDEILDSMWRCGLPACQLTGSGSACFAVASTPREANRRAARLRSMMEPGAVVVTAKTTSVPERVDMT